MVDRSRLDLGVALDLVAAAGCLGNTDEPTPASSTPEASLAADGGEVPGPPPGRPNLSVSPDGTLHVDFSAIDRANWHRNLAGFLLQDAIAAGELEDAAVSKALEHLDAHEWPRANEELVELVGPQR